MEIDYSATIQRANQIRSLSLKSLLLLIPIFSIAMVVNAKIVTLNSYIDYTQYSFEIISTDFELAERFGNLQILPGIKGGYRTSSGEIIYQYFTTQEYFVFEDLKTYNKWKFEYQCVYQKRMDDYFHLQYIDDSKFIDSLSRMNLSSFHSEKIHREVIEGELYVSTSGHILDVVRDRYVMIYHDLECAVVMKDCHLYSEEQQLVLLGNGDSISLSAIENTGIDQFESEFGISKEIVLNHDLDAWMDILKSYEGLYLNEEESLVKALSETFGIAENKLDYSVQSLYLLDDHLIKYYLNTIFIESCIRYVYTYVIRVILKCDMEISEQTLLPGISHVLILSSGKKIDMLQDLETYLGDIHSFFPVEKFRPSTIFNRFQLEMKY